MVNKKVRKPKPVSALGVALAEVHTDTFADHFDNIIKKKHDVSIFGDSIFEGFDHKSQAKLAKKLSIFFKNYAEWVKTQND